MGKAAGRRDVILIVALLIVVTVGIYWQVTEFEFINIDDGFYVKSNLMVNAGLSLSTVRQAFAPYQDNWIPLVWISYTIEHDLSQVVLGSSSPAVFHLTNLALHAANTLLVFLLLLALTGSRWRGAFVAALFAVHPLHVQSVVWVAERKDVLSMFFMLLTMVAYTGYARKRTWWRYLLVAILFAMGLMSKPMLVTLPVVLLFLDYWPLARTDKRIWGLVVEKLPLLVLSIGDCAATVWSQGSAGAILALDTLPLGVRLANAPVACLSYIGKMFWPSGLTFYYPHPAATLPVWKVIGSMLLIAAVTAAAIRYRRSRPYILFGWLWYLVTLLPVIGIVQVGAQATADRYTYVPLTGLFIIVAWGLNDLVGALRAATIVRRAAAAVCACAVLLLAVSASNEAAYWRDDLALCNRAIEINPRFAIAHQNLAVALESQGRLDEAVTEYRTAIRLEPKYAIAHYNLARIYKSRDEIDEAIKEYRAILEVVPNAPLIHQNIGLLLARQNKLDDAIGEFREALRLKPGDKASQEWLRHLRRQKQERAPGK